MQDSVLSALVLFTNSVASTCTNWNKPLLPSCCSAGLSYDPDSASGKMEATPAYVISAEDARWQHVHGVLSQLHIKAERVWPPRPSLRLAKEMYASHYYDKHANMSEDVHQKYFSLMLGWKHALQHVAQHHDLRPHDFALVVEDDISLHDDLSASTARRAILHGFEVARSDGWMYLGICQTRCANESKHEGVAFAKCGSGVCSHAIAVTKHKAATLLKDVHTAMLDFVDKYEEYPGGHSMDRLLSNYAEYGMNGTWTVGTNLVAPVESRNGRGAIGLFYQDRARFRTTIFAYKEDELRRSALEATQA